jgi:hypothetical protein
VATVDSPDSGNRVDAVLELRLFGARLATIELVLVQRGLGDDASRMVAVPRVSVARPTRRWRRWRRERGRPCIEPVARASAASPSELLAAARASLEH